MALQSEVSPPLVGDPNKDIKIDGDLKSDDTEDTSQSSEDEVDLEEGEILDSGAEEEKEEEKDFTNSSLKDALDKNCLQNIEQLINQAKNADSNSSPIDPKIVSPRKMAKRHRPYRDADQADHSSEENEGWLKLSPKHKKSERTLDYRNELEAYRGTPPSSPERKKSSKRRKKSSKKSKKSSRRLSRNDPKSQKIANYLKAAARKVHCKYYKEGQCHKGADCPFRHSKPEPRYKRKELCKFYLSGHCNKGKHCVYMHGEFPCKFHHTGSICYAEKNCRFSHDPLTDEMKKVLADYLRHVHGDRDHREMDFERDDNEDFNRDGNRERDHNRDGGRKRHHSRSPDRHPPFQEENNPPAASKRVCLLGSPPRQIRESEETKRWQEEMKKLHHQNHPGFGINFPGEEDMPPPHFPKPNFYKDTLSSPQKQQHDKPLSKPSNNPPTFHGPSQRMFNLEPAPPDSNYVFVEDLLEDDGPIVQQKTPEPYEWEDSNVVEDVKPTVKKEFFYENSQDFTTDIKFDETTQFSEMESSVDGPPTLFPSTHKETESGSSPGNRGAPKQAVDEKPAGSGSPNQEAPAVPIVVPSHLPRKQRELFMRVQQHNQQKENTPSVEQEIKKEEEEKPDPRAEESNWYSSEEDDEDSDEALTEKLKKMQQEPPPQKPMETKPPPSILEMLNKIQQNAMEKNKATPGTQQPKANLIPFLKGIFEPTISTSVATPPTQTAVSDVKRPSLLPDPFMVNLSRPESKDPVVPKVAPMDPRLKNRDPRALPTTTAIRPTIHSDINNIGNHSPKVDFNKFGPRSLCTLANEPPREQIPYKLLSIHTRPPNYTPYLHASQSNPKLLNDPRLRKHLQPTIKTEPINGKDPENTKPAPPKDAPPIPELLLKYEKTDSIINIFESNPSTKSSGITPEVKNPLPMAAERLCDPRTIRRDSRSNSGSDTPPHLTIIESIKSPPHQEFKLAPVLENALKEPIVEKKGSPPQLEKNWTPPLIDKSLPLKVDIKKESDSDSESNHCPPKLDFGGKTSFKKSPSPEREFIAIPKEPPSHDGDAPPVVPPLIIKKIKPTLASHLPRAIADPRMAKLHNPVDPRRPRLAASDKSTKTQPASKTAQNTSTEGSKPPASKSPSGETETVDKEEKPKIAKSIPKKRRLSDKSEEKKKTVHRNRKSSMDYASPLNSYDEPASEKVPSGYNSYNMRPKRNANPQSEKVSSFQNLSSTDSLDTSNFLSDNSNIDCDNSSDGNLKDRFKTIDPTASPFC